MSYPGAGYSSYHDDYEREDRVRDEYRELREAEARDVCCPVCDGTGVVLGTLGNRAHFRCRMCGMDFSQEVQ